jgi:hypothetical protein
MKARRMPNGRTVKPEPGRLRLLLDNQTTPHLLGPPIEDPFGQSTGLSPQNQGQYQTSDFDVRRLAGTEVTIFGAGSVGSYLSYFLGPALLIQNVVDFKKVETRHTRGGRTIYEHCLVGSKKVLALKQKIERDYPGAVVHPFPYNVGEIPDIELKAMSSQSSLFIVAIDDGAQMLRINDLAYPMVEMIQVAMHAGALSGHVAITVPNVSPCLRCILDVSGQQDIHRLDSEPASSWHIQRVAHEAATIAIEILYSKISGQPISRWDISKNLVFITNSRQESSPDGPGIRFEGIQKRPGCPICNT